MALGAVDVDDVRVADAGKAPRFLQQAGVRRSIARNAVVVQQLQRDFALELGVPGAEHVGGRAVSDSVEQNQTSPPRTFGKVGPCARPRPVLDERRQRAIDLGQAVDEPQMADQSQLADRRPGYRPGPSRRGAPSAIDAATFSTIRAASALNVHLLR